VVRAGHAERLAARGDRQVKASANAAALRPGMLKRLVSSAGTRSRARPRISQVIAARREVGEGGHRLGRQGRMSRPCGGEDDAPLWREVVLSVDVLQSEHNLRASGGTVAAV